MAQPRKPRKPNERYKLDRAFLRAIVPDGTYQEYADDDLRGFVVKVAPGGTVAYTIRWVKPDGKQGRRVIGYFPQLNPGEARELARKELASVDKKGDTTTELLERRKRRAEAEKVIGTGLTLGGFLSGQYGDWLRTHNRTADATIARLQNVFADFLGKPLADFNGWIIEKWRAKRAKENVKASTINRELNALKPVFSRAVTWGLIAAHPLTAVKPMKETGGTVVRFLSDAEEMALRNALDAREQKLREGRERANEWRASRNYELMPELSGTFADHLKPMVLLSLNTGIRQGELLALRWADVALDRAMLTIRDESAKSGKTRHIPLNREALETLKAWREQSAGEVVFPGREGKPMTEVKTAWRSLLAGANITGFRWHDMRHHFASRLVMAGVDLNTVRELLGHGDLKMTLRYAHLAPEHKAAAVAMLDKKPKRNGKSAKAA